MDAKLVGAVRVRLEGSTTEELLRLWEQNDRERYSEEAFEAARLILEHRGVEVPAQGAAPGRVPVATLARGLDPASDAFWTAWLRPLLWVGTAIGAVRCMYLTAWALEMAATDTPFSWSSIYSFSTLVEAVQSALGFVLPPALLAGAVLTAAQQPLGRRTLLIWGWVEAVSCGVDILHAAASMMVGAEDVFHWATWTLYEAQGNVTLGGYALLVVFFLTRPQITRAFESPASGFGLDAPQSGSRDAVA